MLVLKTLPVRILWPVRSVLVLLYFTFVKNPIFKYFMGYLDARPKPELSRAKRGL